MSVACPFRPALEVGLSHHRAGRLNEAEAIYQQVLVKQPHHAAALHLLGLTAHQRGDHDQAAQLVAQAVRLNPEAADGHANLGLIYHALHRLEEAATALAEAVRLNPTHTDALNNRGVVLQALGRADEAIEHYRRAAVARPDFRLAHLNLAAALRSQRRLAEAAAAYGAALALAPDDAITHLQLGTLLYELGCPQEAAAHYQRVIHLAPTCFEAHANLGNALRDLGQVEAAVTCYREAVRLRPDVAECYLNLASGLWSTGLVEEAQEESHTALRLKPNLDEAHTLALMALHYRRHPPDEVLTAHRQWAASRTPPVARAPRPAGRAPRAAGGQLRVGFLSADFYDHPIAYFLEPLLSAYDRAALDVTCYASVACPDAWTQRLQAQADCWRDCRSLSHAEVARQIAADGMDVLIDLTGHTGGSRLPALALKPAPLQVSYLGYPGTTGLAAIDYRLTDGYADPHGLTEAQYTETLVRLPHTLTCYAPPPCAPPVAELPALRPERGGRVTFASFSGLPKIAPETIDLWARALRAVPTSRMVLMSRGAHGPEFGRRFRASFAAAGVDPVRIELRASAAIEQYLACHSEVDVVLDTFPFNGHTTLCHALWMGVPVISLAGDRFASRLGCSVLSNAGLPQLVADTPEAFARLAADLADDLPRLAALRRGLRAQLSQSPLMDRWRFARAFEEALMRMASWEPSSAIERDTGRPDESAPLVLSR